MSHHRYQQQRRARQGQKAKAFATIDKVLAAAGSFLDGLVLAKDAGVSDKQAIDVGLAMGMTRLAQGLVPGIVRGNRSRQAWRRRKQKLRRSRRL